jgi:galactokinase
MKDGLRKHMVEDTTARFQERFGKQPDAVAIAPARVNLIGEHTDYSAGFVLPAAIPLYTAVAVARTTGKETVLHSTAYGEKKVPAGPLKAFGGFSTYLAGAIQQCGLDGTPLQLLVHGNMPVEAGLSSSASLLVAAVSALERLKGTNPPALDAAMAARRVENDFVGVPCGFMDQFAVACGQGDCALLLDCFDNRHTAVRAVVPDHVWLVIYSGIRRELAGGGYKAKVEAVKRAVGKVSGHLSEPYGAEHLLRTHPPAAVQRVATAAGVDSADLPLLEHICTENARVHLLRHGLERGDAGMVGQVLALGHGSLSRLFGVSTAAIDRFVARGSQVSGVRGIRLTGAGMGGSLVALAAAKGASETVSRLQDLARKEMHADAQVHLIPGFVDGVSW